MVKMTADHAEDFRIRTRGPRESEVCIILRCSEEHFDPLVYLFFSFPFFEHIFLCWRLIYNSGNLLQREQVFLWDETSWEAERSSGKESMSWHKQEAGSLDRSKGRRKRRLVGMR